MRISPIFGIERGYWKNKAGYTATEVPCGWAGAVMKHANSSIWEREIMLRKPKNAKKNKQRLMDQPTNMAGCRVTSKLIEMGYFMDYYYLAQKYRHKISSN